MLEPPGVCFSQLPVLKSPDQNGSILTIFDRFPVSAQPNPYTLKIWLQIWAGSQSWSIQISERRESDQGEDRNSSHLTFLHDAKCHFWHLAKIGSSASKMTFLHDASEVFDHFPVSKIASKLERKRPSFSTPNFDQDPKMTCLACVVATLSPKSVTNGACKVAIFEPRPKLTAEKTWPFTLKSASTPVQFSPQKPRFALLLSSYLDRSLCYYTEAISAG